MAGADGVLLHLNFFFVRDAIFSTSECWYCCFPSIRLFIWRSSCTPPKYNYFSWVKNFSVQIHLLMPLEISSVMFLESSEVSSLSTSNTLLQMTQLRQIIQTSACVHMANKLLCILVHPFYATGISAAFVVLWMTLLLLWTFMPNAVYPPATNFNQVAPCQLACTCWSHTWWGSFHPSKLPKGLLAHSSMTTCLVDSDTRRMSVLKVVTKICYGYLSCFSMSTNRSQYPVEAKSLPDVWHI